VHSLADGVTTSRRWFEQATQQSRMARSVRFIRS
jgi:hypothetical protein